MNSLLVRNYVRLVRNRTVPECVCKRWYLSCKTPVFKRKLLPAQDCLVNVNRPLTVWDIQRFLNRLRNPKTMDLFRKDQLNPEEYSLIYRNDYLTKWGWVLSHTLLLIGTCGVYVGIQWYFEERKTEEEILNYQDQRSIVWLAPFGFVAFVIPWITIYRRTVPRIYYNRETEKFLMITFNMFHPFKMNRLVFAPGDGTKKDVSEMFAMFGNAVVKKRKFILMEKYFKLPIYSNVMFGFEKKDALKRFEDLEDPDAVFWSKKKSMYG